MVQFHQDVPRPLKITENVTKEETPTSQRELVVYQVEGVNYCLVFLQPL